MLGSCGEHADNEALMWGMCRQLNTVPGVRQAGGPQGRPDEGGGADPGTSPPRGLGLLATQDTSVEGYVGTGLASAAAEECGVYLAEAQVPLCSSRTAEP